VHRAEQILDAIVAKLTAAGMTGVGKHRLISYEPDMELPAVSVQLGPDAPPGIRAIPIIDSELTVVIACVARAATEADLITALMALRTTSHIALQADQTLGLSFVSDIRYGGAAAPATEAVGEFIAGRLETLWVVPYRMNIADPQ
jgi:hypothetical protein